MNSQAGTVRRRQPLQVTVSNRVTLADLWLHTTQFELVGFFTAFFGAECEGRLVGTSRSWLSVLISSDVDHCRSRSLRGERYSERCHGGCKRSKLENLLRDCSRANCEATTML